MGANNTKGKNQNQKFIGTNAQYANLQKELVRLYKKVTGNDLVQNRLRTEQTTLDVLVRLEKKVFGVSQQGNNLLDRTDKLAAQVDKATKFIVSTSTSTPAPSGDVTVTAQLSDAYDETVSTESIVVTWSSTTDAGAGSFTTTTSSTNTNGVATNVFTVDSSAGTTHTITAKAGVLTGTSSSIVTTV